MAASARWRPGSGLMSQTKIEGEKGIPILPRQVGSWRRRGGKTPFAKCLLNNIVAITSTCDKWEREARLAGWGREISTAKAPKSVSTTPGGVSCYRWALGRIWL